MRLLVTALPLALSLALVAPAAPAPTSPVPTAAGAAPAAEARAAAVPRLRVRPVVRALQNPWDVKVLPGGTLLVTERDRARLSTYADGQRSTVTFPSSSVWVSGETGLMSLEVDPRFASNRRFYTCSGWQKPGGGHDVRVNAWRLSDDGDTATLVETLVRGLPSRTGRHGGCRLLIAGNGALVVGTGDAARGTNPRNLRSLGGKTLRLNRLTGAPWRSNPFIRATNTRKRYVLTYGHRNVQGLAQRRDGSLWSVEHGSYRDDEVNRLRGGGDYGWHPVPGYDESVPMTDQSLPGRQVAARWRSGNPTIATSGAAWVRGKKWGRLNGTLAVAALGGERMVFMKFDRRGRLQWTRTPRSLRGDRLRSVTLTPRNNLLVTTSNGSRDRVLRITPQG
ncbi:PQQ-dependent sugar dehydrogenase [Nocardioides euryhalodurans]|uniref:PQQ-dependent sugar dehydrogenase n=1 Tax=Nocardioides euryhalodurans TaxID=2518370 RepID=A0A4P7GI00_9ACTN|nr:PQQ-dependent sugar dehydrogenase [Nocardioides euryhalodurans]QBR91558.1 PQQ-dependent sugar dehydrogenase [Nocardioides euryhalodurans]